MCVGGGGVCGTGRKEVTGELRKQHDEELHDLQCSLYIIGAIKSRWAEHAARMGTQTTGCTTRCSIPDMSKRFVCSPQHPGWLYILTI